MDLEPGMTFRAAYAKHVLGEYLKANLGQEPNAQGIDIYDFVSRKEPDIHMPICIVGAGATGLAIATMLNYIGFKNVTILEASSRVGGRVFTHQFSSDESCPHNYYDVGAMRIPKIQSQKSTFSMIDYLKKNGEDVTLAEYTYNDGNEPTWYGFKQDDSKFNDYMQGLLYMKGFSVEKPQDWPDDQTVEQKTFDQAFKDFMRGESRPDQWSTRAWLMRGPRPEAPSWDYKRTEIAETLDNSTGLFDQAFMEAICDWFDFADAKSRKASWYRVEGGMSKLTDAMCQVTIKQGVHVFVNAPVTAMAVDKDQITIEYAGQPQLYTGELCSPPRRDYKAVFSTTTFACLQRIDLQGLLLSADNYCGIRALAYDRATKVAIKFRKGWWRDLIPNGGVSNTGLPIGNVVYPSWNDGDHSHYTIIVSYSWAQDATRMASLIEINGKESTNPKDPIMQLCFRNLARLWKNEPTAEELESMYIAHHAFAWSHDPNTAGAFALFGPGQFEYLYPQFTRPLCSNQLSICGEAISAHPAWISGAFDSAYNAVYAWCIANGYESQAQRLKDSSFGQGRGKNTAELDEKLLEKHLALAYLGKEKQKALEE